MTKCTLTPRECQWQDWGFETRPDWLDPLWDLLTLSYVLRSGYGTGHVLLRAQASEVPPRQGSHRVAQHGRQHPEPHTKPAPPERGRSYGASGGADWGPRQSRGGAGEAEDGTHAEDSLAHWQDPAAAASVQVCPQSNGLLTRWAFKWVTQCWGSFFLCEWKAWCFPCENFTFNIQNKK